MPTRFSAAIDPIRTEAVARSAGEPEFPQALQEALESIMPVLAHHPEYLDAGIVERLWSRNTPSWFVCLGGLMPARCERIAVFGCSPILLWAQTQAGGPITSTFDAAKVDGNPGDYVVDANAAGVRRVADAMLAQDVI